MVASVLTMSRLCWSRCSSPVTLSSHRGLTMVIPTTTRWARPHRVPVAEVEARLLAYLVWAWHWAQPGEIPWEKACRVELDDAVTRRKREAVQCFASQLTGPEPILSSHTVRRLTRDFEVFAVSMTLQAPYFDRLYRDERDPWGFRSRPYEIRKRALTLACLPRSPLLDGLRARMLHRCPDLRPRRPQRRGPVHGPLCARARIGRERAFRPTSSFAREPCRRTGRRNRSNSFFSPKWGTTSMHVIAGASVERAAGGATDLVAVHWRHPVEDYPLSGGRGTPDPRRQVAQQRE